MKPFKPMSSARQDTLMKAANEVIDMVHMTVDPDAALRKVASDYSMGDKEIDLVSHAVNNALAYDHIHEADEDARGAPFPLTNAENVKPKNEPAVQAVDEHQDYHEPDAIDLAKKQEKNAASSYDVEQDFNAPVTPDYGQVLETLFAVEKIARPTLESDPFTDVRLLQDQIDTNRAKLAGLKEQVYGDVERIRWIVKRAYFETQLDQVKTAASLEGVPESVIAFVAEAVGFDGAVKTASAHITLTPEPAYVVDLLHSVDKAIKEAGAVESELVQQEERLEELLVGKFAGAVPTGKGPGGGGYAGDVLSTVGDVVGNVPHLVLGDPGERVREIASETASSVDDDPVLSREHNRYVGSADRRALWNAVIDDPYLRGKPIDVLIKAFEDGDAAGFATSRPLMLNYIRETTETGGYVPPELLLKARDRGKPVQEEVV